MNLLCPNCQKNLTVPEHFADQLMRCPLCDSQFKVPALPPGGVVMPSSPPPAVTPATPAFLPPPPINDPIPAFNTAPVPAFQTPTPAPEPYKLEPPLQLPPSQPAPPVTPTSISNQPPPPTTPPTGSYTGGFTFVFNPKVLQWVVIGATLLIFVLQFFSWVEVAPGGVAVVPQSAWGAAFGSYTPDRDLKDKFPISEDATSKSKDANPPGVSLLLLFYLFPFFLITLLVTGFVAALPFLKNVKLPAQVEQLLPWKWAILAGLNLVLLLFLTLQLLFGFSLEGSFTKWVDERPDYVSAAKNTTSAGVLESTMIRGLYLDWLHRTFALKLAYLLHLVATAAALMVYWIERRGPKPLPELAARW